MRDSKDPTLAKEARGAPRIFMRWPAPGPPRPLRLSFTARAYVVKADQVDVPASTVVSHLEEIQNAKKPRLLRQLGSNVGKTDGLDGVHFDLAFFHPVPPAYPHM